MDAARRAQAQRPVLNPGCRSLSSLKRQELRLSTTGAIHAVACLSLHCQKPYQCGSSSTSAQGRTLAHGSQARAALLFADACTSKLACRLSCTSTFQAETQLRCVAKQAAYLLRNLPL